ncbi:hypothetical protein LZ32DRAFT_447801 [Colletotrichum eremochloae]|nr:hypothetical protein LZ32DRAFT_447801 [Colletotrichum eremochloae]
MLGQTGLSFSHLRTPQVCVCFDSYPEKTSPDYPSRSTLFSSQHALPAWCCLFWNILALSHALLHVLSSLLFRLSVGHQTYLVPLWAFHGGVWLLMRENFRGGEGGLFTEGEACRLITVEEGLPRQVLLGTVSPSKDVQTSAPAQVWGACLVFQWTIPHLYHPLLDPLSNSRHTAGCDVQLGSNAKTPLAWLPWSSLFCWFTYFFCHVRLQIEVAFRSPRPLTKCRARTTVKWEGGVSVLPPSEPSLAL